MDQRDVAQLFGQAVTVTVSTLSPAGDLVPGFQAAVDPACFSAKADPHLGPVVTIAHKDGCMCGRIVIPEWRATTPTGGLPDIRD